MLNLSNVPLSSKKIKILNTDPKLWKSIFFMFQTLYGQYHNEIVASAPFCEILNNFSKLTGWYKYYSVYK